MGLEKMERFETAAVGKVTGTLQEPQTRLPSWGWRTRKALQCFVNSFCSV